MPSDLHEGSNTLPSGGSTTTRRNGTGPPQSSQGDTLTNPPYQMNCTSLNHGSSDAAGTHVTALHTLLHSCRCPNTTVHHRTCVSSHTAAALWGTQSSLVCPKECTSLSLVCLVTLHYIECFAHTSPQCGPFCTHTCHHCGCTHHPAGCSLLGSPCTCRMAQNI